MPHDDIIINNQGFVDNLDNVVIKQDKTTLASIKTLLINNMEAQLGSAQAVTDFFNKFRSVASQDPQDPGPLKLLAEWDTFAAEFQISGGDPNALLDAFEAIYRNILEISLTGNPGPNDDWADIVAPPPGGGAGLTIDVREQFKRSFSHFLATYRYHTNPLNPEENGTIAAPGANPADTFYDHWLDFMSVTAQVLDSTDGSSIPPSGTANAISLAAYKQVYLSMGFPEADFQKRIQDFYIKTLEETGSGAIALGWFIPSQAFANWYEDLREDFVSANTLSSVGDNRVSVETEATKRMLVIDRILRLLLSIVDVIQRVSAAQAQRLGFLTDWQEAYTDLLTQVPKYTAGEVTNIETMFEPPPIQFPPLPDLSDLEFYGSPVGENMPEGVLEWNDHGRQKFYRNEINTKFQSVLEKIRARRGTVQDTAKAMQSSLNQTQDIVNQQIQMASSVLQQLSTIISQIFR